MRVGLGLAGDVRCRDMLSYAKIAEGNGYDSVWAMEDCFLRDAVAPLASFAVTTEKIKLATGIVNTYCRSPALTAMTIATLDELSGGRVILGLGSGVRSWIEQQGIEFKKPLVAIEEYIEIIRRLLRGGSLTYNGQVYKLQDVKLTFKPLRQSVPIYIAAMGQRMFQLAGKIAEGAFISTGCYAPSYIKWAIDNLKVGVEMAGRRLQDVDIASYVLLSISEDHIEAKESVKPLVAYMLSLACFDPLLDMMGLSLKEVTPSRKAWQKGSLKEAYAKVTDAMLEASAVYGTPAECKKKMKEFRLAGVNLPVIVPVGSDIKRTIEWAKDW